MPLATDSVVVSALLSMSATETPTIGRMVSSATVCAPGTVLTGASFTAVMVICVVCAEALKFSPSDKPHPSVRVGLAPKFVGFSLVDPNPTACMSAW